MGRDPLVVEGPGERSEPLDELGWLPPGEMVGLELLRLNRRMAAGWSRQADGQASRRGVQAEAEERSSAGGAPAEQREIRFGRQLAHVAKRSELPCGCRGLLDLSIMQGQGGHWTRPLAVGQRCERQRQRQLYVELYLKYCTQEPPPRAVCQSGGSVARCVRLRAGNNCQQLEFAFAP